jgi:hypothetical protein
MRDLTTTVWLSTSSRHLFDAQKWRYELAVRDLERVARDRHAEPAARVAPSASARPPAPLSLFKMRLRQNAVRAAWNLWKWTFAAVRDERTATEFWAGQRCVSH